MSNLNKILEDVVEKEFWEPLRKEGITKGGLDLVMLDIEYSPVQMSEHEKPIKIVATQTRGGDWIVDGIGKVSEETLKVWRYRYLKNRKNPLAHLWEKKD